ncbi:MAG: LacI family DNA-binding transcriptional regulator [Candidatus Methanomethyliaceae archaeon]
MTRRPTIRDVAMLAGVSVTTVSRVLNGNTERHVSEETKKRVLHALAELDYVPTKTARLLRKKQTDKVAVLVPDISNPFFACLVRGVQNLAHRCNLATLICDSAGSPDKEDDHLAAILEEPLVGLVFVPVKERVIGELCRLARHGVEVVLADRRIEGWPVVEADNYGGARTLTDYVLALGYRRIAFLAGPTDVSTSADRVRGFLSAMEARGIRPVLVCYGDFTFEFGYTRTRRVLDEYEVDAIMCANDLIAIGALHALRERKLCVPEDIGVTGFDHIWIADLVYPPLTTVDVPAYRIGWEAMHLLLKHTQAKKILKVGLVKGSTCSPRKGKMVRL